MHHSHAKANATPGPARRAHLAQRLHAFKPLIAVLILPLYLALERKWLAFGGNSVLYALAWATIFVGIGVICWALAGAHAGWHLRKQML